MEQFLVDLSDQALLDQFAYFKSIVSTSTDHEARAASIADAEGLYQESDQNQNGEIDRAEFEKLIDGYFQLKNITPNKESYDKYFKELDVNNDQSISKAEFVQFIDKVNEHEILPQFQAEITKRGLEA